MNLKELELDTVEKWLEATRYKPEPKYRTRPVRHPERQYAKFKQTVCSRCGFVPEHTCQLDVDHIDGNHYNQNPTNLQTLCANCHRLKSHQERLDRAKRK